MWVLAFLETVFNIPWQASSMHEAARQGHWYIVRWLHERLEVARDDYCISSLVAIAFEQNNLEQVMWLVRNGFRICFVGFEIWATADWQTRAEIVRYLLEEGHLDNAKFTHKALTQAARFGDLLFVRWLTARFDITCNETLVRALDRACKHGHLAVVQRLIARMNELSEDFGEPLDLASAMYESAKGGSLQVARWLNEHYGHDRTANLYGYRPVRSSGHLRGLIPITAIGAAAKAGHLEVLQFLHGIDLSLQNSRKERLSRTHLVGYSTSSRRRWPSLPCMTTAMDAAAESGHLEVVKWLHANRSEGCTTEAMDRAAANGHLKVVQWLHANRSITLVNSVIQGW